MNITELIKHPEQLNKETLYDLRSLIALYPYYQPARLLMLKNLFLLHDPTFDEELRRAAVYITDRRVIFDLVEAAHYKIKKPTVTLPTGDRTVSLIDNFLSSIPKEEEEKHEDENSEKPRRRKPTAADATVDYVAYLLATDFEEDDTLEGEGNAIGETSSVAPSAPEMKGQNLIDDFIYNEGGRISLKENPEYVPQIEENDITGKKDTEEEYFTETLAGIYIKQGRYLKALEIIKRLNLNYPKKNAYFADQIRFLEKLILISNQGKE